MDGDFRREKILERLTNSKVPIAGGTFSKEFGVSRQIVVGDIALLRASGIDIVATNSGYVLESKEKPVALKLKHKTEDLFDVLCTIVDEGAKIESVSVRHSSYGDISAAMNIANRAGAKTFFERMLETGEKTIGELTGGIHVYNILSDNQLTLLRVQKALNDKGYLIK